MKQTLFCFFLFMSTFPVMAQLMDTYNLFSSNYNKAYVKKNDIKQIIVHITIGGRKSYIIEFDFDKNGFLQKETISDSLNNKVNDYWFKYNSYGDLIERVNNNYELDKTYTETWERTYKDSLMISEKWSLLPYTFTHSYFPNGKLKQSTMNGNGSSLNSTLSIKNYNYTSSGNLESIQSFIEVPSGNFQVVDKIEYKHDSDGKIIGVNKFNGSQSVITYDDRGYVKLIKSKMPEDVGGIVMMDEYEYIFWK